MSATFELRGRDVENPWEAAREALIRTRLDAPTVVRARARLAALLGGKGEIGVDWRTGPEAAVLAEIVYAVVAAHPGIQPRALAAVLAAIEALCPPRIVVYQSTGLLRTFNQTKKHVDRAHRRHRERLTPEQATIRKAFTFWPIAWAESLVITGLVDVARESGVLEAHPWAHTTRVVYDGRAVAPVRVDDIGITDLARRLGFESDAFGRVPSPDRRAIGEALVALTTQSRSIAVPVRVPLGPEHGPTIFVDDIEVTESKWITPGRTLETGRRTLDIHPAAIVGQLKSAMPLESPGARFRQAQHDIGAGRMHDEFVRLDLYLRYRLQAKAADARQKTGTTPTDGCYSITASRTVLWELLGLDKVATSGKRRREAELREAHAVAFCEALGTLATARLEDRAHEPVWVFSVRDPSSVPKSAASVPKSAASVPKSAAGLSPKLVTDNGLQSRLTSDYFDYSERVVPARLTAGAGTHDVTATAGQEITRRGES